MTSLITKLTCVQCGKSFAENETDTCTDCGPDKGILDVHFDMAQAAKTLTRASLRQRALNHWRYRELLPLNSDSALVPQEIGMTPLIEAPRLASALGIRRLRLKDDGRNASGSFKDRASSIGVSRALQQGYKQIACASTGNAASSLAHCAAAVGMPANIFVSKRIPDGKLAQLLAYGARIFKVNGSYDDAYKLCAVACEKFGWYNRNCAVNPYLVEGKKTCGLEIAEQCMDDAPDWVSASVGDGCSIAGVHKGLVQMKEIGIINWDCQVLGVQAEGVAPIVEAMQTGSLNRQGTGDTYADSIHCPVPRNWRKAVQAVGESGGQYITVSDDQIREAVRLTGRLSGIFAEPAAATAVAGIAEARRQNILTANSSAIAIISGNGLKDISGAMTAVGLPNEIEPSLKAVEKIVELEKN